MLKVGELASRSGLTVRTLHHYDSIGLLTPSARSDAGYRLYNRNDIARLHQIQALRRFGMALADIAAFLDSPDASPAAIIGRQIAALDRQIADAAILRTQLAQMQQQLQRGEEPELSAWLNTLELMNMHDKYFTKEEQQRMPILNRGAEWSARAAELRQMVESGIAPVSPAAQALAARWMTALQQDTGNDPALAARLDVMWSNEQAVREHSGITPEMRQFLTLANVESKLALYAKHMRPEEMDVMRRHFRTRSGEWTGLIAEVRAQMEADPSPATPAAKALASRWLELLTDMIGKEPGARERFRTALESEPELQTGRMMTEEMLDYLRQAA
ncbi:MAG TPA: MerR family transcriptional regulator [Pseudoduganella sp.]